MLIMKSIIKILIICGAVTALFVFSCKKPNCKIEFPDDIKPIDWEGYNDVNAVFWNFHTSDCRGSGYPTGYIIKIYGKIDPSTFDYASSVFHSFFLVCEQEHDFNFDYLNNYNYSAPSVKIFCHTIGDELQDKFASCAFTEICYIKGELSIGALGGDDYYDCCYTVPAVILHSIDDIYFEEEEE